MSLNLKKTLCCATLLAMFSGANAAFANVKQAQLTLPEKNLTITSPTGKDQHFKVEMAVTPEEQEIGEMFRKSVPENGGMLFVWKEPQISHMWMRNTLVPLDMIFIAPSGRIVDIAENTIPHSERDIASSEPVKWTLELAGGTAEKNRIFVGDNVALDKEIQTAKQKSNQRK